MKMKMTEEELIKEATSTTAWRCITMIDRPLFVRGYIMGAEPREKRIAELEQKLETERSSRIALVNNIAELEKENANLKVLRKYELNIAKLEIEKLEKENAELKERCSILDKSLITSTKNNIERQKIIDEIKEQLTKAEEIILKLSTCLEGHSNNNFEYNLLQEAEQFLKEK